MKVLHVITGLASGGAERQLRDLVALRGLPTEVAVLTNPGVVAREIRAAGTRVHELGMRGNRDVRAVGSLARLVRAGGYDVVHTHLFRAGLYGRLAARLAGVPAIVATEHSIGEHHIEGRAITKPIRLLARGGERLGHVTVAVSSAAARRLRSWGVPASRIEIIPNGLDHAAFAFDPVARKETRAELGIPQDAVVVGGVGRLARGKRFDVLVEAVAGLPEVVLLLAGDGPARADLAALAREAGAGRRVVFAGESSRIPALLSAMDVFAAPSQEETFGLAVLEALAAGLPAVYAACPALDELPAGFDTPAARRTPSTPHDFRKAVQALIKTAPTRFPVPAAVRHYDIKHHVARIEALYTRVHQHTSRPKREQ
ncbi:glycosyltransferase [Nonomuraea sediminis]|uniref:glycosyltransferase n=1 Tax=Nonomuraea sediminis TaxID=2835864 RepID=UPI001BDBC810|nr:glycosyltransferase [Nonomuraea sediminis]